VGLSPVSVDDHCVQARPPLTEPAQNNNRSASSWRTAATGRQPQGFQGLGTWPADPAETWPLPNYLRLAPSSPPIAERRWLRTSPVGEFERRFPYGYGPARV